jgi:hypothetical protein
MCTITGCNRPHYARRWCRKHYERWRRTGDPHTVRKRGPQPSRPSCKICDQPHHAHGRCMTHYMQWWRYGEAILKLQQEQSPLTQGCVSPDT